MGIVSQREFLDSIPCAGHEGPLQGAEQRLSVFPSVFGSIAPPKVHSVDPFPSVDSVAEIQWGLDYVGLITSPFEPPIYSATLRCLHRDQRLVL